MLNIFSQKSKAFGLDISDLSLKIANLEKIKGGLNLTSFGNLKSLQVLLRQVK